MLLFPFKYCPQAIPMLLPVIAVITVIALWLLLKAGKGACKLLFTKIEPTVQIV